MGQLEVVDGVRAQVFYGDRNGVGVEKEMFVLGRNRSGLDHVVDVIHQRLMEFLVHDYDGKAMDLFCLDQGHRFKEFVEGAEPSGHNDKPVGVLEEQYFADKEVPDIDRAIEIGVGVLFERKFDIDADASTADILGAAVGGFHDPGTTPGHDGEPELRDCRG